MSRYRDTGIEYRELLISEFDIDREILNLVEAEEENLMENYKAIDDRSQIHQARVLKAFQDNNISDTHFAWSTGYGYDDAGRDAVEKVYAQVFQGEDALVRTNIVNGTHAIALALLGVLRRGDKLIYCTGMPYDTLQSVIGVKEAEYKEGDGSLKDYGIDFQYIDLNDKDEIDLGSLKSVVDDNTKMIAVQRSMGYGWRNNVSVNQIEKLKQFLNDIDRPDVILMVDNCYSEFVDSLTPGAAGADLICGSLIKNPGGGLALSGGYIVGRKDLIEKISFRLTCPGIGRECGLTYGQTRAMLQGLFFAPRVVNGALKSALLLGKSAKALGFSICPDVDSYRGDIIQGVRLNDPNALKVFCSAIQKAAPIDSHIMPIPAPMPGYEDDVIMAAGAFVQGASIELSCDGPLREPYNAYFQGGLTYEHGKLGVIIALNELRKAGII